MAFKKADFSVAELKDIFLANYRHEVPLLWFDWRIKELFGLDVFAKPFPKKAAADIKKNNIRLLVLRSEISDEEKSTAIGNFLEINDFRLSRNENIGTNKEYSATYRDFKSKLLLPTDYVEWMCSSKYFNHFYDRKTIQKVRKRWMEGKA